MNAGEQSVSKFWLAWSLRHGFQLSTATYCMLTFLEWGEAHLEESYTPIFLPAPPSVSLDKYSLHNKSIQTGSFDEMTFLSRNYRDRMFYLILGYNITEFLLRLIKTKFSRYITMSQVGSWVRTLSLLHLKLESRNSLATQRHATVREWDCVCIWMCVSMWAKVCVCVSVKWGNCCRNNIALFGSVF